MAVLAALTLLAMTGYFGFLAGRRVERGRIEVEDELRQAQYVKRRRLTGGVQLTSVQIKR